MTLTKIKSVKKIQTNSKRYDIEVDKVHNFFVNNILVHNCSATYYFKDGQFGFCGPNWEFKETTENTYSKIADKYNLKEKLTNFKFNIAIQGEIIGPGIQKNKYKLTDHDFLIFNIFDIDNYKYFNYHEVVVFCRDNGLKTVPPISSEFTLDHTVDELVEKSIDKSELYDTPREGLVFRSIVEDTDPELGRLSFKVINPNFLLKHEKDEE